jgi:serine/threonine protein phosphatase 1
MIKALKERMSRRAPDAQVPPGLRVYAIGDIHGRSDLLDVLLQKIGADDTARGPAETHLVFLGDVVDRGPDSTGAVERLRLLSSASDRVHLIKGNHEEMMLAALDEQSGKSSAMRLFFKNGGRETMLSYGVAEVDDPRMSFDELRQFTRARIPMEHLETLRGMKAWVVFGDYLFVHAGIRPGVPIEEQSESDLRWIRDSFLRSRANHGHVVVHGHSIVDAVDFQPNRIGVDTGAFASGRLSAVGLEGAERWVIAAEDAALNWET